MSLMFLAGTITFKTGTTHREKLFKIGFIMADQELVLSLLVCHALAHHLN